MEEVEFPLLARLVDNDELWANVRDFDRILSDSEARLPRMDDESQIGAIVRTLHQFAFDHFHLTLVFRFKVKEIGRGIVASMKDLNPVVLFNLSRALVEHTASLAYQDQALLKVTKEISTKQDENSIFEAISRHENIARRLYYGGTGSSIQVKRIHVNDLLEALKKIDTEILSNYDRLCEFVHPNYSSNTLVSSGTLAAGSIGVPAGVLSPELRFARDVIEKCADIESKLIFSSTKSLIQIGDWVKIASQSGTKISNIFSVRSSHSGDGRTKDSAIYFSKARTRHEAFQAFYAYLEKEGLELRERRMAGIENGFLFYIVRTDRGDLWVKYKMTG